MFNAAPFPTVKVQNQFRYLATDKQMQWMWYTYTHTEILLNHEAKWMQLEIVLNKTNHIQKAKMGSTIICGL